MSNRFATFADPEDVSAGAAKPAQKAVQKDASVKKVVIKAKEPQGEAGEGFETIGKSGPAQRGGRGGRGRGGDRPQGESRRGGRPDGERRGGRGGRGGRGRGGDRPQGENRAAAADGEGEAVDRPQTGGNREKRFHKYTGKAREEAHPFDRKSGTGRGKRDEKKGGHGKGNWGNDKKPEDGEAKPDAAPVEEEKKVEKVVEEEEPIQYEEVGLSLDDFLAQKQAKATGMLKTNQARAHDKVNLKGTETGAEVKRITTIDSRLKADQVYAPKVEGGDLFAFSAKEEEVADDRRGPRRDGRPQRDAQRKPREAGGRGGRKGGKIVVDDSDFPTL